MAKTNAIHDDSWFFERAHNCKNFCPYICDECCEFEPAKVYKSYVIVHKKPDSVITATFLNVIDEVQGDPRKIVAAYITENEKTDEIYYVKDEDPSTRELLAKDLRRNGVCIDRKIIFKEEYDKLTQSIADLPEGYFERIYYTPIINI